MEQETVILKEYTLMYGGGVFYIVFNYEGEEYELLFPEGKGIHVKDFFPLEFVVFRKRGEELRFDSDYHLSREIGFLSYNYEDEEKGYEIWGEN